MKESAEASGKKSKAYCSVKLKKICLGTLSLTEPEAHKVHMEAAQGHRLIELAEKYKEYEN